ESDYTIGLQGAVSEAIEIGKKAKLPVHIAHIKALGQNVWGQSTQVIGLINAARKNGQLITADQYPWDASATGLTSALLPRWVMEGGREKMIGRLSDPALLPKIIKGIAKNLHRRGGPDKIQFGTNLPATYVGKTLTFAANKHQMSAEKTAIKLIISHAAIGIISYNMQDADITNFMAQPWVMTSSDGSRAHPRKYGSFPRKYDYFVKQKSVLSVGKFIRQSSGLPADTFSIPKRGYLRTGYFADVLIFDPGIFKANATYGSPERLSDGVRYLTVNGKLAIEKGAYTGILSGHFLKHE
ncbi:MAG: hypothetical protein JKY57_01245, partial [Kordiimonadaceae bacterium]|nr:hypothetical protein [Kordiimonadaceae bacterium]